MCFFCLKRVVDEFFGLKNSYPEFSVTRESLKTKDVDNIMFALFAKLDGEHIVLLAKQEKIINRKVSCLASRPKN